MFKNTIVDFINQEINCNCVCAFKIMIHANMEPRV
jgi:hypothetical protein